MFISIVWWIGSLRFSEQRRVFLDEPDCCFIKIELHKIQVFHLLLLPPIATLVTLHAMKKCFFILSSCFGCRPSGALARQVAFRYRSYLARNSTIRSKRV